MDRSSCVARRTRAQTDSFLSEIARKSISEPGKTKRRKLEEDPGLIFLCEERGNGVIPERAEPTAAVLPRGGISGVNSRKALSFEDDSDSSGFICMEDDEEDNVRVLFEEKGSEILPEKEESESAAAVLSRAESSRVKSRKNRSFEDDSDSSGFLGMDDGKEDNVRWFSSENQIIEIDDEEEEEEEDDEIEGFRKEESFEEDKSGDKVGSCSKDVNKDGNFELQSDSPEVFTVPSDSDDGNEEEDEWDYESEEPKREERVNQFEKYRREEVENIESESDSSEGISSNYSDSDDDDYEIEANEDEEEDEEEEEEEEEKRESDYESRTKEPKVQSKTSAVVRKAGQKENQRVFNLEEEEDEEEEEEKGESRKKEPKVLPKNSAVGRKVVHKENQSVFNLEEEEDEEEEEEEEEEKEESDYQSRKVEMENPGVVRKADCHQNRSVFKLLADSMFKEGELASSFVEIPKKVDDFSQEKKLPQIFSLKIDTPVEKSEFEKELDPIWKQMEFYLQLEETGPNEDPEVSSQLFPYLL